MGAKDYQRCVAGGHRGLGISAASVRVFAAPPCTTGTWGRLPDPVGGRTPSIAVCVLLVGRARRTASALLEVAMQSAFQEKCSYTMAVRGLLGGHPS